jgi:hypothetical protein
MWRRVDLVSTEVSDKRIAALSRVEKSASEEPACKSTRRHIPEEGILHSHRGENVKYYNLLLLYVRWSDQGRSRESSYKKLDWLARRSLTFPNFAAYFGGCVMSSVYGKDAETANIAEFYLLAI